MDHYGQLFFCVFLNQVGSDLKYICIVKLVSAMVPPGLAASGEDIKGRWMRSSQQHVLL